MFILFILRSCPASHALTPHTHTKLRKHNRLHVRVTCCAYIISVEVVITPACIALMIGASTRGSRLNSTCTPQEHQCLYYLQTSTPRLPLGIHKTRSRSAKVHARTDHCTKPPAVLADEPSCSCGFRYSPCVDNTEDNRTS